jgi:hypothetical protein
MVRPRIAEEGMKYRYTAIFSIKGLSLPPSEGEKTLVIDSAVGLRAILTSQPNSHTFEGDRSLAVAGLMLRALFNSEPTGNEFKQRVATAVEELQAARQREFGSSPFLIVIGEGEIPSFNPAHERDAEDFIVCFDGADKGAIRGRFHDKLTALLNAIVSEAETVIGIRKVADPVVFFREDGKPVYSYTFSAGPVRAYISRPLADNRMQAIGELYRLLSADTIVQRVQRLIRSSFETEDDPLRSFLAAWSAFEIFVNKVFGTYESSFFDSLLEERHSEVQRKYLRRIREVMKDKYRLTDKFAAVSFQLSPATGDEDLETVLMVKKVRDELSQGETVDEARLPVKPIRDLASKYLRLHVERDKHGQNLLDAGGEFRRLARVRRHDTVYGHA